MTRERAKELSKLYKAYSDGRTIQLFIKQGSTVEGIGYFSSDGWIDLKPNEMYLQEDINFYKYRIKPEPKLIPFTFEDNGLFKDKWIIFKEDRFMCKIIGFDEKRVYFRSNDYTYFEFLRFFTFEDGSPCGKYVEE